MNFKVCARPWASAADAAILRSVNERPRFRAEFGRTNKATEDAELSLLKDNLHSIVDIQVICHRYGVPARVFESGTGRVVGDINPDGSQAKGWGQ